MSVLEKVEEAIAVFAAFQKATRIAGYECEPRNEWDFVLRPQDRVEQSARAIDLNILGLTHGNEIAGLFIVNEVLRLISTRLISPRLNIAFSLGNVPAARRGLRFGAADLNRAFGLERSDTYEHVRARELEAIFESTDVVIDFHQTQSAAISPFHISRFDGRSFRLFRAMFSALPMVTYFDSNFSASGMTTVNYHHMKGGAGFGFELGMKGIDHAQIELGVATVLKAIALLERGPSALDDVGPNLNEVYTFETTLTSTSGSFALEKGWANMSPVEGGRLIGVVDGRRIHAEKDALMLFPKYPAPGETAVPNTEVCRLLRPMTKGELEEALAR